MNQFNDIPPPGQRDDNTAQIPWVAMLCYLPVFCLYPWSLRKEMPEIEEHARQGMLLFIVELSLFLITVPVFYKIIWIAILVISGLGIWAAYNGRDYKLPILWDLFEKIRKALENSPDTDDKKEKSES